MLNLSLFQCHIYFDRNLNFISLSAMSMISQTREARTVNYSGIYFLDHRNCRGTLRNEAGCCWMFQTPPCTLDQHTSYAKSRGKSQRFSESSPRHSRHHEKWYNKYFACSLLLRRKRISSRDLKWVNLQSCWIHQEHKPVVQNGRSLTIRGIPNMEFEGILAWFWSQVVFGKWTTHWKSWSARACLQSCNCVVFKGFLTLSRQGWWRPWPHWCTHYQTQHSLETNMTDTQGEVARKQETPDILILETSTIWKHAQNYTKKKRAGLWLWPKKRSLFQHCTKINSEISKMYNFLTCRKFQVHMTPKKTSLKIAPCLMIPWNIQETFSTRSYSQERQITKDAQEQITEDIK